MKKYSIAFVMALFCFSAVAAPNTPAAKQKAEVEKEFSMSNQQWIQSMADAFAQSKTKLELKQKKTDPNQFIVNDGKNIAGFVSTASGRTFVTSATLLAGVREGTDREKNIVYDSFLCFIQVLSPKSSLAQREKLISELFKSKGAPKTLGGAVYRLDITENKTMVLSANPI